MLLNLLLASLDFSQSFLSIQDVTWNNWVAYIHCVAKAATHNGSVPWRVTCTEWELGVPAGVAVWMDAHLACSDDAGEDQLSLHQYDWLRRLVCSCQMCGGEKSLNAVFSKPAKYYLPVRPSKFPFPFDFKKNCVVRETDLCCGLKLIRFELRLWILVKLLPVAAERTGCDFCFFSCRAVFLGVEVGRTLGIEYKGNWPFW